MCACSININHQNSGEQTRARQQQALANEVCVRLPCHCGSWVMEFVVENFQNFLSLFRLYHDRKTLRIIFIFRILMVLYFLSSLPPYSLYWAFSPFVFVASTTFLFFGSLVLCSTPFWYCLPWYFNVFFGCRHRLSSFPVPGNITTTTTPPCGGDLVPLQNGYLHLRH